MCAIEEIREVGQLPATYCVPRLGRVVRETVRSRASLRKLRTELEILRRVRRLLARGGVLPDAFARSHFDAERRLELQQIVADAAHPIVETMVHLIDHEFGAVRKEIYMSVVNEESENIAQEAVDAGAVPNELPDESAQEPSQAAVASTQQSEEAGEVSIQEAGSAQDAVAQPADDMLTDALVGDANADDDATDDADAGRGESEALGMEEAAEEDCPREAAADANEEPAPNEIEFTAEAPDEVADVHAEADSAFDDTNEDLFEQELAAEADAIEMDFFDLTDEEGPLGGEAFDDMTPEAEDAVFAEELVEAQPDDISDDAGQTAELDQPASQADASEPAASERANAEAVSESGEVSPGGTEQSLAECTDIGSQASGAGACAAAGDDNIGRTVGNLKTEFNALLSHLVEDARGRWEKAQAHFSNVDAIMQNLQKAQEEADRALGQIDRFKQECEIARDAAGVARREAELARDDAQAACRPSDES